MRIKSILARYGKEVSKTIHPAQSKDETNLMLTVSRFADNLTAAYKQSAPNLICAYIYELSGAVNKFYHETKILTEPDEEKKAGYVALIALAKEILETCIDLLGFSAPEKM